MIADPLERPRDEHHSQTVFAHPRRLAKLEDPLDDAPVRAVDELVEIDERLGALEIALDERIERHTDHLLAARAHLLETLDEPRRRLDVRDQLRQLRDRHAVIGHPLEVEVHVEDREDEPQVGRNRGLAREQ